MKEVIWIVGSSSAGKQTFIKKLIQDPDLAARFGLGNRSIEVCKRSVTDVGDLGIPRVVSSRKHIPEDVATLLDSADVALIKWQYVDSSCETPQALLELLPNAKHRILLLNADPSELANRLESKDWWQDLGFTDSHELVGYEMQMVDKFVSELRGKLDITCVDSGTGKNYQIVS